MKFNFMLSLLLTRNPFQKGTDEVEAAEEEEDDSLRMAKHFNYLAQIIFALLFVIFIIVFWSVALSNYLAGPEAFLDTALY